MKPDPLGILQFIKFGPFGGKREVAPAQLTEAPSVAVKPAAEPHSGQDAR